jgi:hypothetical protein
MLSSPVRTALAMAALCCGRVLAADAPSVSVRVYDGSAMHASIRESAIQTARAIVGDAGIAVEWRDCTAGPDVRRCHPARAPQDLILRIMPDVPSDPSVAGSTLETHIAGDASVLGFAVIEPSTGTGTFATIVMSRVNALAQRTGVPSSFLLGRVLAHEAGHLLLGADGHSRHGLMRPIWTPADVQANRADDWRFSEADRQMLHRRLTTPPVH